MARTLYSNSRKNRAQSKGGADARIRALSIFIVLVCLILISRLFVLMILDHDMYKALAADAHEIYTQLIPKRGGIYIQDIRSHEEFPLAINRDYFLVYADTRQFTTDEIRETVFTQLNEIFQYNDEQKEGLRQKLSKINDPYEPIEMKVDDTVYNTLKQKKLPGIGYIRRPYRYYPEQSLAAQVVGFVSKDASDAARGQYGVEGYWNAELAGTGGYFEGAKSAVGQWIPLAGRLFEEAKDGSDIVLTIDRTLQFKACEKLRSAMQEYKAQSASLIIMDPHSGAIRAMCSLPDFNPNDYSQVESIDVYNNNTILTPYEPGSIFKPITMAAAIDAGVVGPNTVFHDYGQVEDICDTPIRNAERKIFGSQTMIGVLENSINTGMVYAAQQLGKEKFLKYINDFGFGLKEGIELDTEGAGTIEALYKNQGNKIDCYAATASFGQGITVTPLQMVTAFSAIANGGTLMKPYIVDKVRSADGKITQTQPIAVRNVIDSRTASLVQGMLVKVIDNGQAGNAAVEGYYLGGKTGTAQIAGPGGYGSETNHSFVGFGPVDNPAFAMIVKFEKPERAYSATTAAPTFSSVADFILRYYEIPPQR